MRQTIPFIFSLAIGLCSVLPVQATLKFYYDPATGNVSFDTRETRTGVLNLYYLQIVSRNPPWHFRTENVIRLSPGSLFTAKPDLIGDSTAGTGWRGLYTIGDVLPTGLSKEFWTGSFVHSYAGGNSPDPYIYGYVDFVGGGRAPNAEFIYGRPDGEFNNRWDLVDPNTLKWATTVKLVYRPWSGEVIIDSTSDSGGYISAIILESQNRFLHDAFVPFFQGPYISASADLIGLFGDAFEPGRYSLGTFLPQNMTRHEFESIFTRAQFLGRAGFQSRDFLFEAEGIELSLEYVPEPPTLALGFLAALSFIGVRVSASNRR